MLAPSVRYLTKVGKLAAIGVFIIAGTHFFVFQPSEVNGRSMENTLVDEEIIFIDKFSMLFLSPERGDIISAIRKGTSDKIVKRVVGMPGDQISIRGGKVFITEPGGEEFELDEPYTKTHNETFPLNDVEFTYPTLPEQHFFVMGDNRLHSADSRNYGPIDRTEIVGIIRQLD